ncbi:MAG: LacI family DNA-binding transcriptional regulator [Jiangellaceae bacterium]
MSRRRPTISDVAHRAGVSTGAVSYALNNRPGVGEATRRRILVAADELGWQPSHRARSLSTAQAFALGLIVARPPQLLGADPFFPPFIAGVETVLAEQGRALVLQVVPSPEAETAGYRRLAAEGRVDGVFLSDLRHDDSRIALLQEVGLPAVTLNRPDRPSPFTAVCLGDRPGFTAAVDHLISAGHQRIAHVAGPQHFVHGRGRRQAFEDAMRVAGLASGPVVEADFTAAAGARATAQLLDLAEPPTAIAFANDLMAIAGVNVARERGIDVPGDLSVTGFDDAALAAHIYPPLTTVRTDTYAWGQTSARVLLAVIDGTHDGDVDMPPGHLVVRRSTAAPNASTERRAHA